MADLNTPKARLVLARLELQIEQQRLVKEQRDVRLSEIADERANIEANVASLREKMAENAALWDEIKDKTTTASKRLAMQKHEGAVVIQGRQIRLLELDDEVEQVAEDIAASDAHIAKLEAEVSQQKQLLKSTSTEKPNG